MLKQSTEEFEKIIDDLILFKRLVYISEHQQENIIQMYYDSSLREHQEVHKMIEVIS